MSNRRTFLKQTAAIRFFPDSASIGPGMRAHVAADGSILGLRSGPMDMRRIESLDMSAFVDGLVKSMAPRMAALVAALASRKEIALPTAQLDRFAGAYSLGGATIAISRDGDHLAMRPPGQPAVQLLAMSATEFFVRNVDLVSRLRVTPRGESPDSRSRRESRGNGWPGVTDRAVARAGRGSRAGLMPRSNSPSTQEH